MSYQTRRSVTPDDVVRWPHILTQTMYTRGEVERFLAKVDVREPEECWPWAAALTGKFNDRPTMIREGSQGHVYASRMSFELATGQRLGDLFACHHCDDGPCCNPGHVFAGTAADNTADMIAKGRHRLIAAAMSREAQAVVESPTVAMDTKSSPSRPLAMLATVERPESPTERRDWVCGYKAYLRGGAAAWDRYDLLRAEGFSPSMALYHATTGAEVAA